MNRSFLLILTALVAPSVHAQATFQPLGDLAGGTFNSGATGVSADGSVVVGGGRSSNGNEAFRWTGAGGMLGLGDLTGGTFSSYANAISADGAVIVGRSASASSTTEAFRWTVGGGMQPLGDLPGGAFYSDAYSVSANGAVVVGGSYAGSAQQAFRWENGVMAGLGDLPGGTASSGALGVSADGSVVVGGSNSTNGDEAFRWTAASGMVPLGDLPGGGFSSLAHGVSADGAVVVGTSETAPSVPVFEVFRWTQGGGMQGLGHATAYVRSGAGYAASADGSVVVGYDFIQDGPTILPAAIIWTVSAGMRPVKDVLEDDFGLDLSGWWLAEATGVSADGTVIVGRGQNPSGNTEAWRAVIPVSTAVEPAPDPAALRLAAFPNPARGAATLRLTLTAPQAVRLTVFDALGRRVALLHDGPLSAGTHALAFDASALPAGLYIARATAGASVVTRRFAVAR